MKRTNVKPNVVHNPDPRPHRGISCSTSSARVVRAADKVLRGLAVVPVLRARCRQITLARTWRHTNNGWAFFVVVITIIKININYGHYCLSGSLCCLVEVMSLSSGLFVFVFMCCICVFGAFSVCGTEDALTNKRMTTMYAFGSNL